MHHGPYVTLGTDKAEQEAHNMGRWWLERMTESSRVTNKVIQHKRFNTCASKDEEST